MSTARFFLDRDFSISKAEIDKIKEHAQVVDQNGLDFAFFHPNALQTRPTRSMSSPGIASSFFPSPTNAPTEQRTAGTSGENCRLSMSLGRKE